MLTLLSSLSPSELPPTQCAHNVKKDHQNTLGEIASISFKFHFQTDYQQTLWTHTQGCHGCQKIRNLLRNLKILIARSTIIN